LKKLGADFTKPFDYRKILAPPTLEELASMGYSSNVVGSEEDVEKATGKKKKSAPAEDVNDIF
jgi:hypothetical protein